MVDPRGPIVPDLTLRAMPVRVPRGPAAVAAVAAVTTDRPDPSAQLAFGALRVLRERGLRVSQDISISTADDDSHAQSASPPLTTIQQPAERQGASMARLLVTLVAEGEVPARTIIDTAPTKRGPH